MLNGPRLFGLENEPSDDPLNIFYQRAVLYILGLLRCLKKRLVKRLLLQAPQAPFKAPIHSKCCIGGFRVTGLALVVVLRCD